jgi:3-deoxy-D-manno-octulosonic-acid transferase
LTLIHAVSDDDRRGFYRLAPEVPVEVTGDTRYDRVIARARAAADLSIFAGSAVAGRHVLVAGSTWPDDEELLVGLHGRKDLLLVIVPHEPTPDHVASLIQRFPGARPLSALMKEGLDPSVTTVIVDSTGQLAALYRIGTIAYVGGGFGDGVHSVLEPASYGIPVISGPRIERSRDAVAMEHEKVLSVVRSAEELLEITESLLADRGALRTMGAAAQRFVDERTGATGRILDSLYARGMLPGSEVTHESIEVREAGENFGES